MTKLQSGAATDVGRVRTSNQDQMLVALPLFAVADGMGGHAAGEVASLTAVEALRAAFEEDQTADGLAAAARAANRSIWDRAQEDVETRGMGTTLVAVALVSEDGEDRLAIVNVGDSRVYLLRQGELEQLTTDHSLVQELVDDGQLSEVEATVHPQRHVLTRALGVDPDVVIDGLQLQPVRGDRLLLCSDGLSRELTDNQIASVLRRFSDPQTAARELVSEARGRGGNDNITVVIVDVTDDDDRASTASAALAADPGLVIPTLAADEGGKVDAGRGGGRRARSPQWHRSPPAVAPKTRAVTFRVIGFVLIVALLGGGAVFAIGWYARGSYYVGLDHSQLIIFRGRPGGLLWFQPTVARRTGVTTSQVPAYAIPDLVTGKEEATLGDANRYVSNLQHTSAVPVDTSTTTPAPAPAATTVPAAPTASSAP